MAKFKIQKGLSDADMFKGVREEETFETAILKESEQKTVQRRMDKKTAKSQEDFYREFLTETIATQIGKALLDIKMEYYKEDVRDFFVHVKKDGKKIILETGPKKEKAN